MFAASEELASADVTLMQESMILPPQARPESGLVRLRSWMCGKVADGSPHSDSFFLDTCEYPLVRKQSYSNESSIFISVEKSATDL
jgi:hypothetical protein